MAKTNGSSTPIYMIFTVIVVSIGLLLYDYSRIMAQQEALNRALESACEVALAQYDKGLFLNFGIHAVDKEKIKEGVNTWVNGSMAPFGTLEDIQVSFGESSHLANPQMIKEAILQAHQERFIVELGVDVLEQWSFIQNIDKLFEAMEIFTGLLVVAEKLQSAYRALSGSYEEIRSIYQNLKPVNTKQYLVHLQELRLALKEIESRISEIKALMVDQKHNTIEKEALQTELEQRIAERIAQSKAIDAMYLQVLDLENAMGRLQIYKQEWLDFQKALGLKKYWKILLSSNLMLLIAVQEL